MDENQTPVVEAPPPPPPPAPEKLSFSGSGSEYFRIWIVNLLLTILTLGIYSAWAKVRRSQYFYRNTHLAGASFDYHGEPLAILKGRIIALVLFVAYNQSANISPELFGVTLLALGIVMPWLLRQSFRFRLHNSSYRGLRFRFSGTTQGAYNTFLGYGVLALITLYMAAPLMHQRVKHYQHGNSWYGGTRGSFHAKAGAFYGVYARMFLYFIGASVGAGVLSAVLIPKSGGSTPAAAIGLIVFMVLAFMMIMVVPYMNAKMQNIIWNNTRLGEHRFESTAEATKLAWIYVTNFLGVLLTLGLFMPWASVRLARYQASTLTMIPASNLDDFVAAQGQDVSATGDATAEFFDIDIGL